MATRVIENQVVSMEFQNSNFDSRIKQSQTALDNLSKSLNMQTSVDTVKDLDSTARRFSLSSMVSQIGNVGKAFSALDVIAVTTIANITNKAVNAGLQLAQALTIQPVKMGFQEYETQINAIQTILANTSTAGTDLNDVTAALDELNTYADKTIYNFTEMTRNIGTFTAAGVSLDTSTEAIKGIANLAAVSGSNAQQASTAMYQLSQALASGRVTLMDWNSVVNAGMGGKIFQDELVRTSELLGTGAQKFIDSAGSFRDSLTDEWLTTEVLTETLAKFTGDLNEQQLLSKGYTQEQVDEIVKLGITANDAATKVKTFTQLMDTLKESLQSGWTNTWEILIGDFEEAKELFTYISDSIGELIGQTSDARNNLLSEAFSQSEFVDRKDFQMMIEAGYMTVDFQNELIETARIHGIAIDEMLESEGLFIKTLESGWLTEEIMQDAIKNHSTALNDLGLDYQELEGIVKGVLMGDYGNGVERKAAIADIEQDYELIQNTVNSYLKNQDENIADLLVREAEALGYTQEQTEAINELAIAAETAGTPLNDLMLKLAKPTGRELLVEALQTGLTSVLNLVRAFGTAWDTVFVLDANMLYGTAESINNVFDVFAIGEEEMKHFVDIFTGVFSIAELALNAFLTPLQIVFDNIVRLFGFAGGDTLELLAAGGRLLTDLRSNVYTTIDAFLGMSTVESAMERTSQLFGEFGTYASNSIHRLKEYTVDFIDEAIKMDKLSFTNIGSLFGEFISGLGLDISGLTEYILNFKDSIISKIQFGAQGGAGFSLLEIPTMITDFIKGLIEATGIVDTGLYKKFVEVNEGFFDMVDGIIDTAEKYFPDISGVIDFLQTFAQGIQDFFASITGGDVAGIVSGIVLILVVKKILDFIATTQKFIVGITTFLTGLKNILEGPAAGLTKVLNSTSKAIDAFAFQMKVQAFKEVAIAVTLMVGAIWALALLPDDKLLSVSSGLAAISITLGLFFGVVAAMSRNGVKVNEFSLLIVAFAGSILVMQYAMTKLSELQFNNSLKEIGTLILLIGVVAGLATGLSIVLKTGNTIEKSILIVLALAGSMLILAQAMRMIADTQLQNSLVEIGALIILVGVLVLVTKEAAKINTGSMSAVLSLIGIVLSIFMLTLVIKSVADMPFADMVLGIVKLVPIFGIILTLLLVLEKSSQHAHKAGIAVLLMSTAITIMVASIGFVSLLSPTTLGNAILNLGVIMLIFTLFVGITQFAGEHAHKAGVAIIAMSISMLLLTVAMGAMTLFNQDDLLRVSVIVAGIGVIFALIIASTRYATDVTKSVIKIGIVFAILAASLGVLTLLDEDKLSNASKNLMGMVSLFVLTAVVFSILTKLQINVGGAVVALGMSVLVFALMAGLLFVLDLLNLDNTFDQVKSIALLLVSLSATLLLLSVVGSFAPAAITGIGVLAALIGTIGVIVLAITAAFIAIGVAFNEIEFLEPSLDKGIEIMNKVATGIGGFIGNFLAAIGEAILGLITVAGKELNAFAVQMVDMGNTMLSFPDAALDKTKMIVDCMLLLTGATLLAGVTEFLSFFSFGNPLVSVIDNMIPVGEKFVAFSESISSITLADSKKIENLGNGINTLVSAIPTTGGFFELFTGSTDMGKFGEQIAAYGGQLVAFADSVQGADFSGIDPAADATERLATMAKALPNEGGALGAIMGENNMDDFAGYLVSMSENLIAFADDVKGVDFDGVYPAADAVIKLAEMAKALPNEGGLLGDIMGNNDMSTFAQELVFLGAGLLPFAKNVAGVDFSGVDSAAVAVERLALMAQSLPNSGGVVGWWAGENGLGAFGDELKTMGVALVDFGASIANITNIDMFDDIGVFLGELLKLATGDFTALDVSAPAFATVFIQAAQLGVESIKSIQIGIESEQETLSGAFYDVLKRGLDYVETLITPEYTTSGTEAVTNYSTGITNNGTSPITAISNILNGVVLAMDGYHSSFSETGETSSGKYADGIQNGEQSALSVVASLMSNVLGVLTSNISGFTQAGADAGQGFVNGFKSKEEAIKSAAKNASQGLLTTMRTELDEHSPSKETFTIGDFAGIGMVDGWKNGSSGLLDSASSTVKSFLNTIKGIPDGISSVMSGEKSITDLLFGSLNIDSLIPSSEDLIPDIDDLGGLDMSSIQDSIADSIDTEMNFNPTISPTIDLTGATTGLDELFSGARTLDFNTTFDSFASLYPSTPSTNTDGTNKTPTTGQITNVTYNQTISAPKEISSADVYRNTKSQLALLQT